MLNLQSEDVSRTGYFHWCPTFRLAKLNSRSTSQARTQTTVVTSGFFFPFPVSSFFGPSLTSRKAHPTGYCAITYSLDPSWQREDRSEIGGASREKSAREEVKERVSDAKMPPLEAQGKRVVGRGPCHSI